MWSSIQFYHLLNGSRQKGNLTWDCTNPNPAYHWTSRGEFYCESDLTRAISNALTQTGRGQLPVRRPGYGGHHRRPREADRSHVILSSARWRGLTVTYRATSFGRLP